MISSSRSIPSPREAFSDPIEAGGAGYGEIGGIKDVNCRHNFYPFWEGISKIPPTLERPEPKAYNGKTYDYYQATQQQRAMEREIRALKRERYATDDPEERRELTRQIKQKTKEYNSFSEAMGIRAKENRLLMPGERGPYASSLTQNRNRKFGFVEGSSKQVDMSEVDATRLKAIDTLNSSELREMFMVGSGARRTYVLDTSFFELSEEHQRELCRAMVYMDAIYGIDWSKVDITVSGSIQDLGIYVDHPDGTGSIYIRQSIMLPDVFLTTMHELVHHTDHRQGWISTQLVQETRKELGLSGGRMFDLRQEIIGEDAPLDYLNDNAELLTHCMERSLTNQYNEDTEAFIKLLKDKYDTVTKRPK